MECALVSWLVFWAQSATKGYIRADMECELVSWLVFWAQSTTKGYIRADMECELVSWLVFWAQSTTKGYIRADMECDKPEYQYSTTHWGVNSVIPVSLSSCATALFCGLALWTLCCSVFLVHVASPDIWFKPNFQS